MLMTSTRRRTMAQIIISKETSEKSAESAETQLDAARKTFIMRVAVFIIFLPPAHTPPPTSARAAVASQTTNLHLKQEQEQERALRKRKRKEKAEVEAE